MKKEIIIFDVKGVKKRPKLSDGQMVLYEVITQKLKVDKPITLEETITMWTKNVCRNIRDGVPVVYEWWFTDDKGNRGRYVPMTDYEIKYRSLGWLMQAIGALVLKGYLKIIPTLELA